MQSHAVVFCTTCKGRAQHVKLTLPQNIRDNPSARFVLVNYNSRDNLEQYVRDNHRGDVANGTLIYYRFTEPGPFRMAHAKNLAHRLAIAEGATALVNLDADNYAGRDFSDYVREQLKESDDVFLWSRMIKGELPRGISGRIAVTADKFLAVGGYDEAFAQWSPDDKDFNSRLQRMGCIPREVDKKFLCAIPHPNRMRFKEYPEAEDVAHECYESSELVARNVTIANWGKFGRGTVYRNFGRDPVVLSALPTRIFGIGMHKTATTSLHEALTILGYDSAHWRSAHWAKAIWEEMAADGRSKTLERSYALCDLPITLLYRELDVAYPGSKFILTLRPEYQWVESVRNHWTMNNRYRSAWDRDPFTHSVHKLLYGQRNFDERIFKERYRRHNAEVLEYFKGRPEDLLVMDMGAGADWYELCGFLCKRIPEVPYPRKFERDN